MAVNLYGIEKFCDDIECMIGFRPNIFWRTCWKFVSPVFLVTVVIFAVYSSGTLSYHNYLYPGWATAIGWIFGLSSVSAVPIMFVVFLVKRGYFKKRVSQPSPTFV